MRPRDADLEPTTTAPGTYSLGPLEAVVMEVFWEENEATVRDVYELLRTRREIAYTTVLSTTRNLFAKGFLSRQLQGKAHLYWPRFSRRQFTRSWVSRTVDDLLERFAEPALVHFLDRLTHLDEARLNELEELIEARRRERNKPPEGVS